MAHTSLEDYEDYAQQAFEAADAVNVRRMIAIAERMLKRRAGVDFFTTGDEALAFPSRSEASQDWIFATCVIADWLLVNSDPDTRADIAGPYKSERLGDWSMSLRDKMWSPFKDIRIRHILSEYSTRAADITIPHFTTVGVQTLAAETAEIGS